MPNVLTTLPLFAAGTNDLWYAVPLIIVISLVYSATRHERTDQILAGAARIGTWICGFMLAIFAVLAVASWRL